MGKANIFKSKYFLILVLALLLMVIVMMRYNILWIIKDKNNIEPKFAFIGSIVQFLLFYLGIKIAEGASIKDPPKKEEDAKIEEVDKRPPPKGSMRFEFGKWVIQIKGFFIIWVLIFLILNIVFFSSLSVSESFSITSPKTGKKVNQFELVEVKSHNENDSAIVWVIVYDYATRTYFPNEQKAEPAGKYKWESKYTQIGSLSDSGKKFDIYALSFNMQDPIHKELLDSLKNPSFQGMKSLPTGIYKTAKKVTVFRNLILKQ